MGLETNRIAILIGFSVIISSIFKYFARGSLIPDIMDIAIGYYLINSFVNSKPKESKTDATSKLIPIERYGLIVASIVLIGLSVLPWLMFANFNITSAITTIVLTALKIATYCGVGIAYRKYVVLKEPASYEQDKKEEK